MRNLCPICNSEPTKWRTKRTNDGKFEIDRCRRCNYAFVNPRPSPAELRALYEKTGHGDVRHDPSEVILERERAAPNSSLDARRILQRIDARLPAHLPRTFLDVGCGYGFFSREAQTRGYQVTALEGATHERQIAAQLLGFEPRKAWFEEACFDEQFSVILLSQVLEHVHDVNAWIRKAHSLMNQGGVLCVALPSFDSIVRRILSEKDPLICPPVHLNFFSRRSLERLLEREGFACCTFEDVSRVPLQSIRKRLPRPAGALAPALHRIMAGALGVCDHLGMGQMINAFAVRV